MGNIEIPDELMESELKLEQLQSLIETRLLAVEAWLERQDQSMDADDKDDVDTYLHATEVLDILVNTWVRIEGYKWNTKE